MALLTERAIFGTFEAMLEEMPFDKITVAALSKRAGISPNTFYYHYHDIYELFDVWSSHWLETMIFNDPDEDWKEMTKRALRFFKEHSRMVMHIMNSVYRERLEKYVYTVVSDHVGEMIERRTEGLGTDPAATADLAYFCRCTIAGLFIEFTGAHMEPDIDETVNRIGRMIDRLVEATLGFIPERGRA